MGQYYHLVNINKKEYISCNGLATREEDGFFGIKFFEISWNCPEIWNFLLWKADEQGGGDMDEPPASMGRWAGDKVALVGDYDGSDLYQPEDFTEISKEIADDFYKFRKWLGKYDKE